MGTFRVEGDTETSGLSITSQGLSASQLMGGLRLALVTVAKESGDLELSPQDFTLVNMALAESGREMELAKSARRAYRRGLYWMLYPVAAFNLGIGLWNLGRMLRWWP
jgi:hypothetical protein